MNHANQPIDFAGTTSERHRHICAFFHSPEEEYSVLLPFIKDGIERGEKAFHIVDPSLRDDHLRRLHSVGIDVPVNRKGGQLEIYSWLESYLHNRQFSQKKMLAMVESILRAGPGQGYSLTRLVAHMEWAREDMPGINDLIQYESRLNYFLPKYKDSVICTYDLKKFGIGVAMDIMRTHPLVILGETLQENPFFVPPNRFLRELHERSTYRKVASF